MNDYGKKDVFLPVVSLFTSAGTLVCCALPALLVSIGAGAVLAGVVSTAPWLVALSRYKLWLFVLAGVLLLVAGVFQWRARNKPCPVDAAQAKMCMRLRRINAWVYGFSVAIYLTGAFFAFVAPLWL
ncbi:MAG: hypothetical protein FJX23_06080 [Alphaproteobacteria bacterium]|nr:hypothetical protein [Alphaproteobacteria bacterium]